MREKISVVVPVFNERDNIEPLFDGLRLALAQNAEDYEIVFVDDGSEDGSGTRLESLSRNNPNVRVVQFRRNFGQTAALAAGFEYASGELLVATDADLQNDPRDIPSVLAKLREGFDVVSCWRRNRKDSWLTRRLPSRPANLLISRISGVAPNDYGCTLKGYRKEVLEHVRLYGEMHRFIPLYASWAGARIAEIELRHHRRSRGASKYDLSRTYKVLLDLITVEMLANYSTKPMYFFGGVGLLSFACGMFFAAWTLFDKYLNGVAAHNNPLLLLAVFLFILGIQFIMMGLGAELLIRTYFESQGKSPYIVRQTWNCAPDSRSVWNSTHSSRQDGQIVR
jgi:glycosyltransferase involved in cell wall biosynthesis